MSRQVNLSDSVSDSVGRSRFTQPGLRDRSKVHNLEIFCLPKKKMGHSRILNVSMQFRVKRARGQWPGSPLGTPGFKSNATHLKVAPRGCAITAEASRPAHTFLWPTDKVPPAVQCSRIPPTSAGVQIYMLQRAGARPHLPPASTQTRRYVFLFDNLYQFRIRGHSSYPAQ